MKNFLLVPDYRSNLQLWEAEEADDYVSVDCSRDPGDKHGERLWGKMIFKEPEEPSSGLSESGSFFSSSSTLVLHNSIFDSFRDAGLTGWNANPTLIRLRNGEVLQNYSELFVSGFGGIASEETGCRLIWRCPDCGVTRYSPGFDHGRAYREAKPGGEDFFFVWPLFLQVVCTHKAKTVLERFNLNGLTFRDVDAIEEKLDFYGDAPPPPYLSTPAKAEIEDYRSAAPSPPEN